MHQPLTSRNLFLEAFDWYRGGFHFQDWYQHVTACAPREWNLHIVASRTYPFSPRKSVPAALNLVDSWMRINGEDQQLPRAIWADLEDIWPPENFHSSRRIHQWGEPSVIRIMEADRTTLRSSHIQLKIFYKCKEPLLWPCQQI